MSLFFNQPVLTRKYTMDLTSILNDEDIPPYSGRLISSIESSPSPMTPRSGRLEATVGHLMDIHSARSMENPVAKLGSVVGGRHLSSPTFTSTVNTVPAVGSPDDPELAYKGTSAYTGPTTSESSFQINHRTRNQTSRRHGSNRVKAPHRTSLNTSVGYRDSTILPSPSPSDYTPKAVHSISPPSSPASPHRGKHDPFCQQRRANGFLPLHCSPAVCRMHTSSRNNRRMPEPPFRLPSISEIRKSVSCSAAE